MYCDVCRLEVIAHKSQDSWKCPVCWLRLGGEVDGGARDIESAKPQEVAGTHYKQGLQVTPWELQKTMPSTGSAFVDGRRCDAIKYVWRKKGNLEKMLEDMKKARHCLDEGIKELQKLFQPDNPAQE